MDMGVGSFVFSQGIVSAIPVIQLVQSPRDLRPPLMLEILSVLEKSLPVLVLGLLRLVLVKGTQYPVSCPSLLLIFELDTLLTMDEGTCHRIRRTLELLPDACADTSVTSFFASAYHEHADIATRAYCSVRYVTQPKHNTP